MLEAKFRAESLDGLWAHIQGFSPHRFGVYTRCYGKEALGNYFWNIQLTAALFPLLNGTEILLKNSINRVLETKYGSHWFDSVTLIDPHKKALAKAKEDAQRYGTDNIKLNLDHNDVVAELGFRFWTNLLVAEYSKSIWNPLIIGGAFPNLPSAISDKRKTVRRIVSTACDLRNRVCHHERIIHVPTLQEDVKSIRRCIAWMSPVYAKVLDEFCHFDRIFADGPPAAKSIIEGLVQLPGQA